MSKNIDQFVNEIMNNPQLIGSIQSQTVGLKELVEFANSRGYSFTEDEALSYLKEAGVQEKLKGKALSGAAASSGVTQTNAVQTAEVETTEAVQIETTQTGVAETSVFVAAEAVILAT